MLLQSFLCRIRQHGYGSIYPQETPLAAFRRSADLRAADQRPRVTKKPNRPNYGSSPRPSAPMHQNKLKAIEEQSKGVKTMLSTNDVECAGSSFLGAAAPGGTPGVDRSLSCTSLGMSLASVRASWPPPARASR